MAIYDNGRFLKELGVREVRVTSVETDPLSGWYMTTICPRCGGGHRHEQCPQVRAVEYDRRGRIKRVEYFEVRAARPIQADVTWDVSPAGAVIKDISVGWGWGAGRPTATGDEEE